MRRCDGQGSSSLSGTGLYVRTTTRAEEEHHVPRISWTRSGTREGNGSTGRIDFHQSKRRTSSATGLAGLPRDQSLKRPKGTEGSRDIARRT